MYRGRPLASIGPSCSSSAEATGCVAAAAIVILGCPVGSTERGFLSLKSRLSVPGRLRGWYVLPPGLLCSRHRVRGTGAP